MPRSFAPHVQSGFRTFDVAKLSILLSVCSASLQAQTFNAGRIDGRPAGHVHDSGGFDPIISVENFTDVGVSAPLDIDNINGSSLIRLPDWLAVEDRIHPDAQYYLYFAHHAGRYIRLAWASEITGDWHLFNVGTAVDRAWGINGNNTGELTPGTGVLEVGTVVSYGNAGLGLTGHIASPDVYVDNVNQRFAMYFHGTRTNFFGPPGQQTTVATSSNGLNFNDPADTGQAGHGPRDVFPTGGYFRMFEVGDATFAYSNFGELSRGPLLNEAGEVNTLANADSPGGFWTVDADHDHATENWWELLPQSQNPIWQLYGIDINTPGNLDPRHFAMRTRTHIDPSDTNVYVFYSARFDTPESIFMTIIDTDGGSMDPSDWTPIGQRVILEPELDWEGGDLPITESQNGSADNVRQLRDPTIFEDTMGTADPSDDQLYLLYCGRGEEAIGIAQLVFNDSVDNTASPQGDLFTTPALPSGLVQLDYNGENGPTQTGFAGEASGGNGIGLFEPLTTSPNPFETGQVEILTSADRWRNRNALVSGNSFAAMSDLLRDFAGPVTGGTSTITITLPAGDYEVKLYQHESNRSAPETAELTIVDADGATSSIPLVSGFGTNPSEIVSTTHPITSNGTDTVVFTIDNTDTDTTGAYPINGIEISPTTPIESPDNDMDGISDDWEEENGLDPTVFSDRDEDFDSDGYTNFEEWVALTDPNDSSSFFNVTAAAGGAQFSISFIGNAERNYSIEQSTDLGVSRDWVTVNGPLTGTGESTSVDLPIEENGSENFYRVRIEIP